MVVVVLLGLSLSRWSVAIVFLALTDKGVACSSKVRNPNVETTHKDKPSIFSNLRCMHIDYYGSAD
jgi:hypothetical protein